MAAATLFANKGYPGTAIREIVETAGITKPTLYYYFRNKEDLYITLMDLAMETFFLFLDQSLSRSGSMRTRLTGLFTDISELFRNNVDLLRLVNSMIYGPKGATPAYDFSHRSAQLERVLVGILQAGVDEGELREEYIHEVMLLLMGILRSMQILLVIEPEKRIMPHLSSLIDIIFDGARAAQLKKETTV